MKNKPEDYQFAIAALLDLADNCDQDKENLRPTLVYLKERRTQSLAAELSAKEQSNLSDETHK